MLGSPQNLLTTSDHQSSSKETQMLREQIRAQARQEIEIQNQVAAAKQHSMGTSNSMQTGFHDDRTVILPQNQNPPSFHQTSQESAFPTPMKSVQTSKPKIAWPHSAEKQELERVLLLSDLSSVEQLQQSSQKKQPEREMSNKLLPKTSR